MKEIQGAEEWYEALTRRWRIVPADDRRLDSGELLKLPDAELVAIWDRAYSSTATGTGYGIRGWYHDLYRDKLAGLKVLDIGCGFGVSTIHFAQHGARMTFADLAETNVEFVRRICTAKGIAAEFLHIQGHHSFIALTDDFDAALAIGSLINAPLDFTRDEIQAILPHLKGGARWLHLSYPKARWQRDGSPEFSQWGALTDGGAPWMEFHERETMDYLFTPREFEVVFDCAWHNNDFNWFDLRLR